MATALSATAPFQAVPDSQDRGASTAPAPSKTPSNGVPNALLRKFGSSVEAGSSSSSDEKRDMKPSRIPVTAKVGVVYSINPKASLSVGVEEDEVPVTYTMSCSGEAIQRAMENAVGGLADVNASQALVESITLTLDNRKSDIPLMVKMEDIEGLIQTSFVNCNSVGKEVSSGNFMVDAGEVVTDDCYRANSTHKTVLRKKAIGSATIHTDDSLKAYEDFETIHGDFVRANSPVFEIMKKEFSSALQKKVESRLRNLNNKGSKITVEISEADMPAYMNARAYLIQNTMGQAIHHADLSQGIEWTLSHADGVGFADHPPHLESEIDQEAKVAHVAKNHSGRGFAEIRFYVDLPVQQ